MFIKSPLKDALDDQLSRADEEMLLIMQLENVFIFSISTFP